MTQPPSFVHPNFPNHVCKLWKALYRIKQAPCARYNELKSFLLSVSFFNAQSITSLFIYAHDGVIVYLLV